MTRVALVALGLFLSGCGDDAGAPDADAGPRDAGPVPLPDAGVDGGERDAGGDADAPADAGPTARPDAASFVSTGPWLEDVTEAAGLGAERVPRDGWASMPDRMSGGVCVLDVDGAAPLDLFFAWRQGSRLYVGAGPLRWEDETAARGLSDVGDALGCLALDEDGDGDDDLLVTGLGSVRLFHREGEGYVDRSDRLGLALDSRDMYPGAAAGDLDGDGDLDLAVAGFFRFDTSVIPTEGCDAAGCALDLILFDAIGNLVLRREEDGRYTEVAADLAPDMARPEPTLVTTISDLDEDGTPEIYVGNDLGTRYHDRPLRRDEAGVFRDVGATLGLDRNRARTGIDTMGFTHGDVDRDGRLDHVATSFEGDPTAVFLCPEGFACSDASREVGTDALADTFRWGAALVDLDLDGWVDLVEATGHLVTADEARVIGFRGSRYQRPNLMHNVGGTFRVVDAEDGDGLAGEHAARGIAIADLDDDGRPDVVLSPSMGRPVVLRNRRTPGGRWLRVALRGRGPNTGAVGARVDVTTPTTSVRRERTAGEGFSGSFDPRLLFGVDADGPATVTVRWPDGDTTVVEGVALDDELVVEEPE